jgi:hypothetical protein
MSTSVTATSVTAQHGRIINYWTANPNNELNRFIAINELNICQLPARVSELKDMGYEITTHRKTAYDVAGRPHSNISHYVLTGYVNPNQTETVA